MSPDRNNLSGTQKWILKLLEIVLNVTIATSAPISSNDYMNLISSPWPQSIEKRLGVARTPKNSGRQ